MNAQKEKYPKLFAASHAKYEESETMRARPWLTRRRIPLLGNCLWNSTLHASPVHPAVLLRELTALGRPFVQEYFEIETRDLDQSLLCIYVYTERPDIEADAFPESEFIPFTEEAGMRCSIFTDEIREKWKQTLLSRERKFGKPSLARYEFIPHVLYRGNINIENCPRTKVG